MVRRERSSFHYERTRLLHRNRTAEFWEGAVDGRPAVIKRFARSHESDWREFILHSRIRHSLLLPVSQGGIGPGGKFAYAMALDFTPAKAGIVPDPAAFAIQILSLVSSLRHKGFTFHWDPDLALADARTGRTFLPAVSATREKGPSGTKNMEGELFAGILQAMG
ncbi:MAG TPA: hypothetical protein VLR94_00470, partial [Acidobacteriota bacterium]|nr:hypothetical protein [Acidobacteriota bacterium]